MNWRSRKKKDRKRPELDKKRHNSLTMHMGKFEYEKRRFYHEWGYTIAWYEQLTVYARTREVSNTKCKFDVKSKPIVDSLCRVEMNVKILSASVSEVEAKLQIWIEQRQGEWTGRKLIGI